MDSVWINSCSMDKRKSLTNDIKTDVLVIGGGIAGILTAYLLQQKGRDVVVIDSNRILRGNTQNTTAKITSQHDLIYDKLIKEFGEDKALQYASANELAIRKYQEIIEERKIDCDFKRVPAYVYSLNEVDAIKKEVEAATKLGIDAEFTTETKLPLSISGAVKFNNQASFHPLKFLKEISKDLVIYEKTKAIEVNDNIVKTDKFNIEADHIIVATHYPIVNVPGYYFLKMHQERSYVLALENCPGIDGMYIDYDKNGYSFRNYNDLLLLGGISHRTGENETGGCYDELREAAKKLFPKSREKYHWSAQDCMTIDGIPYIGKYSDKTPNMYVVTGFNKWGMTSSMVGAMIISDLIIKNESEFSEIFSPKRFDLSLSINNIAKDMVETTKNFIAQKIEIPKSQIEHIKDGHAGIVEHEGNKLGIYKNKEGKVFAVSTKCPHLGCQLKWNADELTWDCPCHGSRFTYEGKLIQSPAVKDISGK